MDEGGLGGQGAEWGERERLQPPGGWEPPRWLGFMARPARCQVGTTRSVGHDEVAAAEGFDVAGDRGPGGQVADQAEEPGAGPDRC